MKYFKQHESDISDYYEFEIGRSAEEIKAQVEYENLNKIPKWYFDTDQSYDWAAETIINEEKTLWFVDELAQNWNNSRGKVVSLTMDDAYHTYVGFALQEDSEFMAIFNHYLLKAYENGILDWLYDEQPDIKIGLNEPQPLGINNVMFPFCFLAAISVTSMAIAVIEKILNKMKTIQSKTKVTFLK